MSGTASLSAAKNRRSGNEVNTSNQPKLPAPQNPRQQQQQQQQQQRQPQNSHQPMPQNVQQQQQQQPHPMEILKSHECRLRTLESNTVSFEQKAGNTTVTEKQTLSQDEFKIFKTEYDLSQKDFIGFKQDFTVSKEDYRACKIQNVQLEHKHTAVLLTTTQHDAALSVLQTRIDDLNTLVSKFATELSAITLLVKVQSNTNVVPIEDSVAVEVSSAVAVEVSSAVVVEVSSAVVVEVSVPADA